MDDLYYFRSYPSTTSVVSSDNNIGSNLCDMENLPFNQRVKRARKFAGLTQEELAVRAGITQKHVERMENRPDGKNSYYTAQVAAACGVSAIWLATNEGQMVNKVELPEEALAVGAAWHYIKAKQTKDRQTTDLLGVALNYLPTAHPLYRTATKVYRDAAKRRGITAQLQDLKAG